MTAAQEVFVRRYGCKPPLDMGDDIIGQARKQHEFYNVLLGVYRQHKRAYQALIAEDPALADVTAEIARLEAERAELGSAIKARRQAAQRRGQVVAAESARLDEIRARLRDLWPTRKSLAAEARARRKSDTDRLAAELTEAIANARRTAVAGGLWWPNSNAVAARAATAAGKVIDPEALRDRHWRAGETWRPLGKHREDPRFGEPLSFTFQVQGGMTVAELFSGRMAQLSIAEVPERDGRDGPSRWGMLTIAVYATERGAYRTLTVPVQIHQPIPDDDDCRIMAATLQRIRGPARWSWQLILTCRRKLASVPPPLGNAACGIDVGWRLRPDGSLRVAVIAWGSGEMEEIVLPARWMAEMDEVEAWEGELDTAAQEAIQRLAAAVRGVALPDGLGERVRHVTTNQKAGAKALGRLLGYWRHEHPDAAPEALAGLAEWDRGVRLLGGQRRGERAERRNRESREYRLRLHRRELYRIAAKRIAARAALVGIDNATIDTVVDRPDAAEPALNAVARSMRVRAAVSVLRAEIERAVRAAHGDYRPYAERTNLCSRCGADPRPTDPAALYWSCRSCGAWYDQDDNSARVLLARALADASAPVAAETPSALAPDAAPKMSRSERFAAARRRRKAAALADGPVPPGAAMD